MGNGDTGIGLGLGAHDTVIGGETPGAANVISGNSGHGVALQQAGTDGNRIMGNTIGLDATGTYSLTNGYTGVFVGFAASNNVVGGENRRRTQPDQRRRVAPEPGDDRQPGAGQLHRHRRRKARPRPVTTVMASL